jgi:drug/metabolite transporter superfamily protein YnfA
MLVCLLSLLGFLVAFFFSEVFVRVYAGFGTLFHRHKKGGEGNQRYG